MLTNRKAGPGWNSCPKMDAIYAKLTSSYTTRLPTFLLPCTSEPGVILGAFFAGKVVLYVVLKPGIQQRHRYIEAPK